MPGPGRSLGLHETAVQLTRFIMTEASLSEGLHAGPAAQIPPSSGLHLASNGKSGLTLRPPLSLSGSAPETMLMHGGLLSSCYQRCEETSEECAPACYHLPRGSSIFHLTRVKESAGKADQQINEDISPSIWGWNVPRVMTSQLQTSRGYSELHANFCLGEIKQLFDAS